jgi:hypothetical protein
MQDRACDWRKQYHARFFEDRMIKFAAILFIVAFVTILLGLLFLLCGLLANGLFWLIRLVKPNFGTFQTVANTTASSDRRELRKVALDFVLETKRLQKAERNRRIEEFLNGKTIQKPALEWTLEALKEQIQPKVKDIERVDLWSICRRHPERGLQFLSVWRTSRENGLRCGWSTDPRRGIKTSAEAGARWLSVLPNTNLYPANSAARILIRNEAKKLRETREEISDAATA